MVKRETFSDWMHVLRREEVVVVYMAVVLYVHCQTELSFTSPLTESSCSESWLAGLKKPACMVWLWPRGLPQGSMPGGEGTSSGVRKW